MSNKESNRALCVLVKGCTVYCTETQNVFLCSETARCCNFLCDLYSEEKVRCDEATAEEIHLRLMFITNN